ncbi:MAG TPA: EamA family transporter [Gemmatimonadaceae bacterium]|nr:EamA family transporter [Gemmatimonadaceae bacterium]
MIGIIIALLAACSYGVGDFLGGVSTRRASWLPVTIYAEVIGCIPLGIATAYLSHATFGVDAAWGAAAGVVGAAGIGLLYRGLGSGTMSVVAPITAVCATALPVLAGVAFGERPATQAVLGIGIAIAAIVLISQAHDVPVIARTRLSLRGSVLIALASGVCVAGFLILMSRAKGGGLWALFVSRVVATVTLSGLALVTRRDQLPPPELRRTVAWCGVFDAGGTIGYVLALSRGTLGITATLISLYPAATLILARFVLGERLRRRQLLGLACAVAAVVLITSATAPAP